MTREGFDKKLGDLQDEVLVLGSMVDKAIDRSIEALKKRDMEEARSIIADDVAINHKRFDIEEQALLLIATQQPMARDLRFIAAVLSIITDLERMADHAEGNAKITLMLGDEPPLKPLIDIPRMALKAREMLRRALDALVDRDAEAAKQIACEDDEIDGLYDQVYRELLTFMIQDPHTITRATHLLWAAHNLERIGDRVTNICERVVFTVTGRMEEMNVSTY
ncbi:MAG: phosphate signaling complex protein PhoU [Chloroflexi bacterium]|nr:phosphate signaling complex protein PhoU [Chloroflexota bacterium]MDA8189025.1 phosphate signaling complex protein PhoU [Dehalococcoidales bacterium]